MRTSLGKRLAFSLGMCVLTALGIGSVAVHAADTFPSKPIKMVVPYPPGGPTDLVARGVGAAMADIIGQPIVVDNKSGASGMIGADQVARSAPDGYTFLANASLHVINPHIYKSMMHDAFNDFVPITQLAAVPLVLVVPKDSPIKTVADVVAEGKRKQNGLNFGSAGTSSAQHLSGESFKNLAGIPMQHVPYKGSAPALTDLVGGQLDLMFDSMPSAMPFIKSGQLRAIAVTTQKRVAALPDVPTVAESGFPTFDISTWYGLWAPKGTPDDIVAKLSATAKQALQDPKIAKQYATMGAEPVGSTPQEFAQYVESEGKKWAKLVKQANVPLQ
ncbi:tripartite tricarboxylate transporter substrate binding protein [Alcaligenaceae bacterium]|nr:tripartite tricarboxylate transporter substrate binding protein [Alcaligenaceae bacterium]